SRTPRRVQELLARCLEKDPRRRLRDAGDLRIELEGARDARAWSASGAVPARSVPWRWRRFLPWGVAGLAIVVAAMAVGIAVLAPSRTGLDAPTHKPSAIPLRVDVTDPEHPAFRAWDHSSVAVTADGMTIAYFGSTPRRNGIDWSICLRRADETHVM